MFSMNSYYADSVSSRNSNRVDLQVHPTEESYWVYCVIAPVVPMDRESLAMAV